MLRKKGGVPAAGAPTPPPMETIMVSQPVGDIIS